ncbi:PQQ-dependent sugar dehydrogenase [Photobacterium sp. CCB-ST2H9]|uniref:PQQ-dependent sugar dehydrogenase n=1 Tax=Photobacterium sp. CCB-ST2H9 TaxID=2912855 RepID=UPI002005100E|nr:PQQ-dependent sugar dehydrogenase [Photobacterium sp. CCB-ST2H9]UTM58448.1 PQQ-dependent sugar dehydrogenase [Photobacterium sp. CCB-ST2H9]
MKSYPFTFAVTTILLWALFSLPALAFGLKAKGSSEGMAYQVEQIADGLPIPWGMTFIDDHTLLVTLREGKAVLLDVRSGQRKAVSGLPEVYARGQGGLLDVQLSPDPAAKEWLYFTYTKPVQGGGVTTLARARLSGQRLTQWQDLKVTRSLSDTNRHFGSRIAFDGRGHVFFSVGDRGHRPNGQDLTNHAATVIRLNLDGSVPKDNPFTGRKDASAEIWSYGHRNPQGLAYDTANQRLWEIEHGPRGGDEINLILPGRNYGWPITSHGKEYWGPLAVGEAREKPGIESPVKVYIPSIAPGSLLLYQGDAFPGWKGNLFAGALVLQHLNRIVLDSNGKPVKEERLFEEMGERIRSLVQSKEGYLYFATDSGNLYRVLPK